MEDSLARESTVHLARVVREIIDGADPSFLVIFLPTSGLFTCLRLLGSNGRLFPFSSTENLTRRAVCLVSGPCQSMLSRPDVHPTSGFQKLARSLLIRAIDFLQLSGLYLVRSRLLNECYGSRPFLQVARLLMPMISQHLSIMRIVRVHPFLYLCVWNASYPRRHGHVV